MSEKVCRICFKTESELYNLFHLTAIDLNGNETAIHKMLTYCCSIEIDPDLPADMCTNCVDACTNAYNFIKQFHKSNNLMLKSLKNKAKSQQALVNITKNNNAKNDIDNGSILTNVKIEILHFDSKIEAIEGEIEKGKEISKNEDIMTEKQVKSPEKEGQTCILEEVENNEENDGNESIESTILEEKGSTVKPKRKYVRKMPIKPYEKKNKVEICSYCGKSYKGCLKYHEELHTDEPKYECEICHEKFIAKDKFKYHRIKKHNIGSHLCMACGQLFHNKTHLRNHMWKHTGIKSYSCDTCGQQFSQPHSLKKHRLKNLCGTRKVYQPPLSEDVLLCYE